MGHGVGGHTDLSHIKIPDYRIYEVTKEKTPELYAYKEKLAREGLKDPWIRNYAFRFDHKYRFSFWTRWSCIIVGTAIGFAAFGGFVYADKNFKCSWHEHTKPDHHAAEEKYKLLYQLKDDYKPSHHSSHH